MLLLLLLLLLLSKQSVGESVISYRLGAEGSWQALLVLVTRGRVREFIELLSSLRFDKG